MTNDDAPDPTSDGPSDWASALASDQVRPPVEGAYDPSDEPEPPTTRWPTVLGVIAIIYASLGLLCQVGAGVMVFFSPMLMKMGGIEIEMPPAMMMISVVSAVLLSIVALVLLVGGIKLVRRRRGGVGLLKTWAILRLLVLVIGIVGAVMMMPMNLEFQEAMQEAGNDRLRESGRSDLVQDFDEDAKYTQVIIMTAVTSALQAAFPLFLGLFLSRRSITEEAALWT